MSRGGELGHVQADLGDDDRGCDRPDPGNLIEPVDRIIPDFAKAGATGITIAAQTVAAVSSVVLSAPPIVLALLAWSGAGWAVWAGAVVGLSWGVLVFEVGVRVGARVYERRAPELLASLIAN